MRFFILLLFSFFIAINGSHASWRELAPGLQLSQIKTRSASSHGNSLVTVVRIDPSFWNLVIVGRSFVREASNKTAKDWSRKYQLVAAINAGMFETDYVTHTGLLVSRGHTNNAHLNHYLSVAAFDPLPDQEIPAFRIFDLDNQDASIDKIVKSYGTVVQNLRLIKRPGINRWSQQGKRWSEAALGEDKEGRVLFIFSRSPYSMHDLNSELLSMDLGLVAAQHLEGGPEAQLYLNIDNVSLDLFGSFETNFQENNDNNSAWPIPNCLGIKPKR